MTDVKVNDRDLASLLRALKRIEPRNVVPRLIQDYAKSVIRIVRPYPPPAPKSKRTGHLGQSWYYKALGLGAKIENLATYAGYVQGEEQVSYHKRRGWKKLIDVAETELDKLIKSIGRRIEAIWS